MRFDCTSITSYLETVDRKTLREKNKLLLIIDNKNVNKRAKGLLPIKRTEADGRGF